LTRRKKIRDEDLLEKRKTQILEAAIQVFSKKGFEGSTTKEIAKKAKVSEGTIFRYFTTKKDILVQMLNILVDQTLFDFIEQIERGVDAEEAIKSLLKLHYRFIVNNYDLLKILLFEVQFHKELKEKFYNNVISSIYEVTARVIKEVTPDIKTDPRVVAETMTAIFLGLIITKTVKADKLDEEKIVNDTMNIVFHGIKTRDS